MFRILCMKKWKSKDFWCRAYENSTIFFSSTMPLVSVMAVTTNSSVERIGSHSLKSFLKQYLHAHVCIGTVFDRCNCSSSPDWLWKDPFLMRFQCKRWGQNMKMHSRVQLKLMRLEYELVWVSCRPKFKSLYHKNPCVFLGTVSLLSWIGRTVTQITINFIVKSTTGKYPFNLFNSAAVNWT